MKRWKYVGADPDGVELVGHGLIAPGEEFETDIDLDGREVDFAPVAAPRPKKES